MKEKTVLDKSYDPKPVEEKWSHYWVEKKIFTPEVPSSKEKFSIVLPPPNVTGSLHMGHALCFTLPDIIVRWKRMLGFNVLWLPGADHASIAVHNVIEKTLEEKGLNREKLGRERFLELAWEWKEKYGGVIMHQLKRLGASLDWTRERFTLDEGFTQAVKTVFVELYKEGLIYRDYYLVNRCPHCGTVLSDIEIEHKQLNAKLYYIKYPVVDSDEFLTVATTRPETMLGDTAVAVHPQDKRFHAYDGKKVSLPLTERVIPVIKDEMVEMEFGTGAVKVTPAHDPVDFEIGKKHNLEQIIVIDGSGKMTKDAGEAFQGLDRFECRDKVVSMLEGRGLLEKVEDYQHNVGHCYRCQTMIEPHLSWQWFVKIQPLAEAAIRVVEEGRIRFIPSNWTKTYFEWMYNIHDWCISRQLWWGHRIPAWYCKDCGEIIVSVDTPQECSNCQSKNIHQDEDVLDTWFSSALWPFGTMGWPDETKDLKIFYPTDLMATGFDIIFFWVARMIMMGMKFMQEIPFKDIFINGLVRDFKKRKMSKSEGNIIDPLEMIDKYGTDALRFTLAALAVPGMDLSLSEERMAGYRTFVNKIWNAARFVLMNLEGEVLEKENELSLVDRWIKSRLNQIITEVNESLADYKFYEAADKIYHFIWHEFCDWYIELVKTQLKEGSQTTIAVLIDVLDKILRLLHPFMPFVTEEIWRHLPVSGGSLAKAGYPLPDKKRQDTGAQEHMNLIQTIITEIRTVRAENRIPPRKRMVLWINSHGESGKEIVIRHRKYIEDLAGISGIEFSGEFDPKVKVLKGIAGSWELALPLEENAVNLDQEKQRLKKELDKVDQEIEKINQRLENENFISKAPAEVVETNRKRLEDYQERRIKIHKSLDEIGGYSN
ncbi:MAG: valine--tRNA ligase [Candidatus Aminicenantes bacterium]|nr:valine--tRNA ligase [Candidatus Aminicenantes bacterium]